MKCGIVGLPNVGKSTLFNALTKAGIAAENYPFCTIEPNVGIVPVPDPRLDVITGIAQPQKVVPAVVEFVDIAGLVQGASQGEGLGNQFLSHIREVDAVVHVIRCFEDPDVVHVMGPVDPVRDHDVITSELAFEGQARVAARGVPTRAHAIHEFYRRCDANLYRDFATRAAFDRETVGLLARHSPDIVLLDGYLYLATRELLDAFPGRLLNLHFSDLTLRRPDGRLLPEVPSPSEVPEDPAKALRAQHEAVGLELHPRTAMPLGTGERLDVGWAIDVLHPLAR